jgi:VWFA-related protein
MKTPSVRNAGRPLLWVLTSVLAVVPGRPGAVAHAQASSHEAQATPTFSVGTSSVLLDVVVRDKKGNLVKDLQASDFEVYEDGAKQQVDSFQIVSKDELAPPPEANAPTQADAKPGAPAAAAATPAAAPKPPTSTAPSVIAFVFDRMSVNGRDMAFKAAKTYVTKGHVEGDVVGVFVIDIALHTIQPFTTSLDLIRGGFDRALQQANTSYATADDRADLRDTIEDLSHQENIINSAGGAGTDAAAVGGASVTQAFEQMHIEMARTFEGLERDAQGYASTNGLLSVVNGLKAIPGRKTVIFFSEGLVIPSNVQAQFKAVIAAANRANVSVYTMDAGGLRVESQTKETRDEIQQASERRLRQLGSGKDDAANGDMMRQLERNEDLLHLNPQSGIGQLAEETGGFLIRDTNDASGAFRRLAEDMRFYYLLSYSPSNDAFDGSYRNISVKLRRSGLQVQGRKGYYAVRPTETAPLLTFEAPAIAQLDRSPRPDAFPIRLEGLSFPESTRPGLAPVLVEVPGTSVTYVPGEKDKKDLNADFTVAVRIKDDRQREVDRLSQHYVLNASASNLDAARRGNILFYREASLKPGRYSLEAVGYDASTKKASVQTTTLVVPSTVDGGLRLSSIILVKRAEKLSAEELKGDNPLYYGDTILYPAMGEPFRKATHPNLTFFFSVYGAKDATRARKATIEVRQGERSLGAASSDLGTPDANGRIQLASALPLQNFAPGAYSLKVTVSDGTVSDTRETPFTIAE